MTNPDTLRANKSRGAFSLDWIQPLNAEQAMPIYPAYAIQASGYKLARKDIMSKTDAFFEIRTLVHGVNEARRSILVHRSNVVANEVCIPPVMLIYGFVSKSCFLALLLIDSRIQVGMPSNYPPQWLEVWMLLSR